jgi:hypothetical protein
MTARQVAEQKKERRLNVFDTVAMYFFTLAGVMIGKYIPLLREGTDFVITMQWSQLIVSCVVSFMLLTAAEQLGGADKRGKRKRFLWRAVAALSYGAFWYNIIGGESGDDRRQG